MFLAALTAAAIAVCPPSGARHHCVHDGDTVWWNGEKIRIADIDAPELTGRCPRERQLAIAARDRLVALLNARPVTIRRTGTDRFGRTLARMGSVGEQLIAEGLASRWPKRRDWCATGLK